MHELAEQWKQFGTTTIHKLECQIVDYQEKLTELEQRQMLLLQENQTLKSLMDQMIIKTNPNENPTKDVKLQKLNIFFCIFRINFFFVEKISTKCLNSSKFGKTRIISSFLFSSSKTNL
jgi:hypothetical protein